MTQTLNGKVAVVTGSTRGFGIALARELLHAGAKVVVSGHSQAASEQIDLIPGARQPGAVDTLGESNAWSSQDHPEKCD